MTTTAGHPFFVEGKGWVCVKDLVVGDKLVDKSGMSEEIDSILRRDEPVSVYNMSVESYENYFVGSRGFLVHNKTVTGPRR